MLYVQSLRLMKMKYPSLILFSLSLPVLLIGNIDSTPKEASKGVEEVSPAEDLITFFLTSLE